MNPIIEQIATKHLTKWTIWKEKRLYINDCHMTSIYNTKKCKQSVYIDLSDMNLHVYTDCSGQGNAWISNENNRIIEALSAFARLLRIATRAQQVSTESAEVIMNNAVLDAEEVLGYYTEWREVRVPINRFGKLATRNRQFIISFKGTRNTAPKNFIPLSEAAYRILSIVRKGEDMLEPYAPVPNYEEIAERAAQLAANN